MHVFVTGATGYIGGSVANALLKHGAQVTGLVRSIERAEEVSAFGIKPIIGTLDDDELLGAAAVNADVIINAADSDHAGSAISLLNALEGTGKTFLHTSGSSIVGTHAGGELVEDIFDEETAFTPSPGRAARVALNEHVMSFRSRGVRSTILCPSLIYGIGHGVKKDSMQVPWLLQTARRHGVAKHFGPGLNRWSNVHIDDLVKLYLLAIDHASDSAFFFAENGENSMREMCEAINRAMGVSELPMEMSLKEAAEEWGEGPAMNTMGSNSRVRARRACAELGWQPVSASLIHEIERGCYV